MKSIMKVMSVWVVLIALADHGAVAAQETEPRPLRMAASNITALEEMAAGRPRPDSIRGEFPGDVLEYRLLFTNTTEGEVRNVVFANPLPAGLIYLADTARSDREDVRVEFSIDGGQSWSVRPEIEVLDENGRRVRRAAPPEMYTNIRWTLTGGISPEAQVQATYRTQVAIAATASDQAPGNSTVVIP